MTMLSVPRLCSEALALLVALVAAASAAPAASAATQRYADPQGSGTACTSASPCDITQAIEGASPGDDVTVKPGLYLLSQTIDDPGSLTIHGIDGQPHPRIQFHFSGQKGLLLDGTTLRHVEVEQVQPGIAAVNAAWSTLDRVVIQGPDGSDCAASIFAGTVRNSLVLATDGSAICSMGPNATGTSGYRNVTAIATAAGGVGIEAHAFGQSGSVTARLVNVIARGGPGGAGLSMRTDSMGGHATISATHSNYPNYWTSGAGATFLDFGANQGTPPQFVNPAARDYRQAASSVTIGAGLNDPQSGAFDLDGDPRLIGTTDIGADEFVFAPTATTAPASGVGSQTATLSGSVNPKGAPASYHFEYGATAAYGSQTLATGAGSSDVAVSASLTGLSPGTTYHYRVVASGAGGTAFGADQVFTTGTQTQAAPTPATTPATATTPTTSPAATAAFAGVKLGSTRLSLASRSIVVRLHCPATTVGRCSGRTRLSARRPRTSSRPAATVKLGAARFSIAAGAQAKLRVRVSRAGRRLFAGSRRVRGKAVNVATSDAGESRTTLAAVTIRRRAR